MDIIVNKKTFLGKLLLPISKFTDKIILNFNTDFIDSISYTTADKQTIILYTKVMFKSATPITDPIKLNIGSVKKLISAFNCISEDIVELKIEQNNISYKSNESSFRFHLKEDGTVEKPVFNLEKINATVFTTQFKILSSKLSEMLKACGFSTDSDKIYIYTKDSKVLCDLTDKTIQNLDSFTFTLSDNFTGTPLIDPIILRIDVFKTLSSIKFDVCDMKLDAKGIVVFEVKDDESLMKYVTTSLIK